jgi:hypothetical protein
MTFLETLQVHKGGLLCLKTELYWYEGRKWDGTPGRICLILDAVAALDAATATTGARSPDVTALLLVDGAPHWVWLVIADVELL